MANANAEISRRRAQNGVVMKNEPKAQFDRGMQVALAVAAAHQPIGEGERVYLTGYASGLFVALSEELDIQQTAEAMESLRRFIVDWHKAHHQQQRGH